MSSVDEEIFVFSFKVASGTTKIPPPMIGALVFAFTLGDDWKAAAKASWSKLLEMGYVVEDMSPQAQSMPLSRWDSYVEERWSEFRDHFPDQSNVKREMSERGVLFSPFAGFER